MNEAMTIKKYCTMKLSIGDVVRKKDNVFYIVNETLTTYRGMEQDTIVTMYSLVAARGTTDVITASEVVMDGTGYVVVGVLTESGLSKARRNPMSITSEDVEDLDIPLVYDSKLCGTVNKVYASMEKAVEDGTVLEGDGESSIFYETIINDIICTYWHN